MNKLSRKAILMVGLLAAVALVLGVAGYAAAEKMTLTGEVVMNDNGTFSLETADKTLALMGDMAKDLKEMVGKKVEVTGMVEEDNLTVEAIKPTE